MKNIHILPTDKPSRYVTNYMEQTMQWQNLFITSDEEIKEGDWALDLCEDLGLKNQPFKVDKATLKFANQECEKIILTTDQDLIKDGIQDIDDEFLEWFVKNPSCEKVEVQKWSSLAECGYSYHIIIPKEEPKHN